jgi:hypothetical protein
MLLTIDICPVKSDFETFKSADFIHGITFDSNLFLQIKGDALLTKRINYFLWPKLDYS